MSSEEIRPPAAYLRLARDGASPAAESGDSGPASCRTLGDGELKEALGGKLLEEAYRLLAACRKESREGILDTSAELLESLAALLSRHGLSIERALDLQAEMRAREGGYTRGILLEAGPAPGFPEWVVEGAPSLILSRIGDEGLLERIREELRESTRAWILSAFYSPGILNLLLDDFQRFIKTGGDLRILLSTMGNITRPEHLTHLEEFVPGIRLRVYHPPGIPYDRQPPSFHPKAYLFRRRDGRGAMIIGSSNLTLAGFRENIEWNYYTSVEVNLPLDGPSPFHRAVSEFASYWDEDAADVSEDFLEGYRRRWTRAARLRRELLESAAVFAMIQTLSRKQNLSRFPPGHFDYIVVDEFHHASAASYRRVLDHFRPRFLLGLTATPERMDGRDVLALCDYNLAAEVRLLDAVDRGILVPFQYFAVHDETDYSRITWRGTHYDEEELDRVLIDDTRTGIVAANLRKFVPSSGKIKALAFCSTVAHARYTARKLADRHGLEAVALVGGSAEEERAGAIRRIRDEEDPLNVICAVDIFNEGVDIPELSHVLFLRPTQSFTVFLQQLGRGLRRAPGKAFLVAVDLVGNFRKAHVAPLALRGYTSVEEYRADPGAAAGLHAPGFLKSLPRGCHVSPDVDVQTPGSATGRTPGPSRDLATARRRNRSTRSRRPPGLRRSGPPGVRKPPGVREARPRRSTSLPG
ncbi:MAG: hypothetical protein FJ280_13190 [Planctomycetes bacterium]|nr:hypothetical protein [Planctomycetota bacterium]